MRVSTSVLSADESSEVHGVPLASRDTGAAAEHPKTRQ